ncbi:FadR/GntR family transcriptional regulator [Pelagibacterium montanilacus]|uniref:FadR/GntR family transcriptional regulator n=1 Tax=Pelagibacterium montanilacus TaxID=2185280 RepID=UPI001FECD418|nr:FadR/GntR family transcriptional regulator [Pelagibacterium montanilacus]
MAELIKSNGEARVGGTLVVQVASALRQAIMAGTFRPGDKLPSEAKLTESHKVSRTVVREAIAALRSDGLVEPRRGAGVFVLEPVAPPGLPFQDIDHARISSIIELLELRSAVEMEAAALAAVRRSPAQDEAIIRRHHAVGDCIDKAIPTAADDFALHNAIAEATNNPRFVEFMALIGKAAIPRATLAPAQELASTAYLNQLHEEHGRIVAAISNGDAEAAREAMREHLQGSQRRYRSLLQRT